MIYCQSKTTPADQSQEVTNATDPTLFSREEACVYLRCSIRTLHLWLSAEKLPFFKIGKRVWLTKAALDHFIIHHQKC